MTAEADGGNGAATGMTVPNAQLWNPDNPHLYNLRAIVVALIARATASQGDVAESADGNTALQRMMAVMPLQTLMGQNINQAKIMKMIQSLTIRDKADELARYLVLNQDAIPAKTVGFDRLRRCLCLSRHPLIELVTNHSLKI